MKIIKFKEQKKLSFFDDLIENLPIGTMLLDEKGTIIRMNKRQEETSQIEREKILGKTFQEAFPKTLEQGLKRAYFELLKNGKPFDIIIDRYVPQYYSKLMTYHARGAPLSSRKYFILLHELEEELFHEKRLVEKRTKELEESKNFLKSLIDSSPNIVISADLTGKILIFNKSAEKAFGYTEKEVIKKKINCLFADNSFDDIKYLKNFHTPKEVLCLKKNQIIFPASLLISDVRNAMKKTIAKLYLLNDLTEKKEMEAKLFLSEKLALYSELMAGIAHQLNNPLIGVINFSEMLLKEIEEDDPKKELAETILKAGKECLRIITSVLKSIKDPHLTFSRININEVLINSLETIKDQFKEELKEIKILSEINPKIPSILGDSMQLKQTFLNMLINSVQAMENGKGIIKIITEFDERKKQVKIKISDTGKGIPREYINKIFLPFFSIQKVSERYGLGLSFAFQIIKNHGGHIFVESEVGRGSTFTVLLPIN